MLSRLIHSMKETIGDRLHTPHSRFGNGLLRSGASIGEDMFQVTLGQALHGIGVPETKAEEALLIAITVLYRDKYNRAVRMLRNREEHFGDQKYFDF